MKKILSLTLVLLMIFSLTFMVSCNDEESEQMLYTEDTTLGTGSGALLFTVEHIDGTKINFNIKTDKTVLSEALLEHGLIEGPVESYGIYVKKVNGITQDYDKDGTYWSLLIDGEASYYGADSVNIDAGVTYTFKATR